MMEQKVISILEHYRQMSIATNRPDGWPQVTMVSYGSDGLTLFFMIARASQKYANICADDRVSIAIGSAGSEPKDIVGLSMAAHAGEVSDDPVRSRFCTRLAECHPTFFDPAKVDFVRSALMRAHPVAISIVDFSQGLGHSETISVGAGNIAFMKPARLASWGFNPG